MSSRWIVILAIFALLGGVSIALGQTQKEVIEKGGNRLVDLQADVTADNAHNGAEGSEDPDDPDDGGWDWSLTPETPSHSSSPSPTNTYGATVFGPSLGFLKGANDPRILIGLLDAFHGMEADPTINSGPDPAFLVQLYKITKDPHYGDLAKQVWYSALNDIGGDPFDPRATAEVIRDARLGQGIPAIYPWDVGLFIMSAMVLEKAYKNNEFKPQAIAMANVVMEDLVSADPVFDRTDSMQWFYDIGLIGSVMCLKLTNVLPSLAIEIRDMVIDRQNEDGSWGWSDEYPQADYQSTAYAVLALFLYRAHPESADARQAGSNFIASTQMENGGWDLYLDGTEENAEADGECILAIALVAPNLGIYQPGEVVGPPVHTARAVPFRLDR